MSRPEITYFLASFQPIELQRFRDSIPELQPQSALVTGKGLIFATEYSNKSPKLKNTQIRPIYRGLRRRLPPLQYADGLLFSCEIETPWGHFGNFMACEKTIRFGLKLFVTCDMPTLSLRSRSRLVPVTEIPPQRPPRLSDHQIYTQIHEKPRKRTFYNSTKTGRFALKLKNQIDFRVICKNEHLYPHIQF